MKNISEETLLKFASELSIMAGKKLLRFQKDISNLLVTYKDAQGVASKADFLTEKFIIKKISEKFKDHMIYAEESFFSDGLVKGSSKSLSRVDYCWVIDPLDGTHNFLNGSDYFAVSIALLKNGKPHIGVVHRPCTGEVFQAISGKGAWFKVGMKKKRKLYIKNNSKKLSDTLLVTGFSTEKGVFNYDEYEQFGKIMGSCRGVRRLGSAALDLCYLANGVWDGFWERELAPWDVGAAGLICLEAGVKVTNFEGEKFDPFHESIMAARAPLYRKFRDLF